MKSKTKETLRELESYIKEKSYALSIFKGYTAINKRGVEKLIDTLYANLPVDVVRARAYLKSLDVNYRDFKKKEVHEVYDNLKNLETEMKKSFSITQFTIVNIEKINKLIDGIYSAIPEEITEAEKFSK